MPLYRNVRRYLMIAALICALGIVPAAAEDAAPALPTIQVSGGRLMLGDQPFEIRGVNYTHPSGNPEGCPELHFGAAAANCPWDQAAIDADMERLHALGVNTVRVFLNYYVFGGARASNPEYRADAALANLDLMIASANRQGIYVLPVLLAKYPQDQMNQAGLAQAVDLYLNPVVRHLAGQTGLLGWDLFNEPDIGSPIDERCWDWDNGDFPLCREIAIQRADFMTGLHAQLRQIDSSHLTTIGMGFAKSYFRPAEAGPRMAALVDFYSFHYYDNDPYASGRYAQHWYYGQGLPGDLRRAIGELVALEQSKPVLVSELGFPSGPGALRDEAALRRDLALSLQTARDSGAAGVILWPFQPTPEELIGDLFTGT
ncbi:MAG: cellulase family glycosylhydrolase [Oscillochloris sp.]|nr:cellulase family glycosylhydrolase [Oscillochloris sp.]